ncbi:MAG TPA: YcxB family protein, partial [Longimicrobiales bacterium]|nr:YcxB family protein [Longimicrobiales bacterium]
MRIEVDITREDWQAYCRFYAERARGIVRYQWVFLAATAAAVWVVLWLFDRLGGRTLDLPSALLGMALIYAIIFLFSRSSLAAKVIPESWLGCHVYDLLPDALHTRRSASTARYPWTSIREVCEDPAYLYLLLDNITAILLPKRAMEPLGGPEAVKAEIERLRRGDAAVTGESQAGVSTDIAVSSDGSTIASAASIGEAGPSITASSRRGRWALADNLLAGLRLCTFLPVQAEHFRPSARQIALLIVVSLLAWLGLERVLMEGEVYLVWYSVAQMVWLVAVAVVSVLLLTPRAHSSETVARMFTALASAAPFVMLVTSLALTLPLEHPWYLLSQAALVVYVFLVVIRAQRVSIGEAKGL